MSKIKAIGVHTYFGGFTKGYMRNQEINTLGSFENWQPAVTWAPKIGVKVLSGGAAPRADMVFGNPPCSRFSHMTYSKFSAEQREDLSTFPDLEDVLYTAKYAGAELLHIENGPLMFTAGDELLTQFNNILGWPEIYFLVLKIDTMHSGLPQKRPRTHVFVGQRPFPEVDLSPVALPTNLRVFFQHWNSKYNYEPVYSSTVASPVSYAEQEQYKAVFLSTRPKVVSELDRTAHSVVSSRHFAWLEQNRWWSVDEYAALQGYDADTFDYGAPPVPLAMALISKSVSPSISEYLSHRVTLPYFDSTPRSAHAPIKLNLT